MDRNHYLYEEDLFIASRSRILVIAIIIMIIGVLIILLKAELVYLFLGPPSIFSDEYIRVNYNLYLSLTGGTMILMGAAVVMQLYLKYGFRSGVKLSPSGLENSESNKVNFSKQDEKLKEIEGRLSEISEIQNSSHNIINNEDRVKLVSELQSQLQNKAADGFISDLKKSIQQETKIKYSNSFIKEQYYEIKTRLKAEISELGRRGNTNLIIGSLTAIVGLVILGLLVMPVGIQVSEFSGVELKPSISSGGNAFITLKEFFPRLSLVLLIEVFAYFFLKLYKSSLNEIKFYQNELTNIEVKYIALAVGQLSEDQGMVRYTMKSLSDTERNFVLQKGQTTVDLEKSRLDNKLMSEFVNSTIGSLTNSDKVKKA